MCKRAGELRGYGLAFPYTAFLPLKMFQPFSRLAVVADTHCKYG